MEEQIYITIPKERYEQLLNCEKTIQLSFSEEGASVVGYSWCAPKLLGSDVYIGRYFLSVISTDEVKDIVKNRLSEVESECESQRKEIENLRKRSLWGRIRNK